MVQPGTTASGTRMVSGTTAYTLSAAISVQITVTYGYTFSSLKALVLTCKSNSNIPIVAFHNGAPGVSSAAVAVWSMQGTSQSVSGDVHWIAIGAP